MKYTSALFSLCSLLLFSPALTIAQSDITLNVPSSLRGKTLIAVGDDGSTKAITLTKKTRFTPPSTSNRLYIRTDENTVDTMVVGPRCNKRGCRTNRGLHLAVIDGAKLKLKKRVRNGLAVVRLKNKRQQKQRFVKDVTAAKSALITSLSSYGLASTQQVEQLYRASEAQFRATEASDTDNDGLVDAVDSDNDGDGILDNYDDDEQTEEGAASEQFPIFSNFKVEIENTLNLHATGLDADDVAAGMERYQTLAIGVAGPQGATVELDCGTLDYCSTAGTGQTLDGKSFPGEPGGELDPDSDGLGTLSEGNTGDFQLRTGASPATIGGGDTYVEYVDQGTDTEESVAGMLNFVFTSTPAIKSVAVGEGDAQEVDYDATNILGSSQNCIQADAAGDVILDLVGWRPQRAGVTAANEAETIDIGGSLITIDIPNAPCDLSGGGGCSGSGIGNCVQEAYDVSNDSNLTTNDNGIVDGAEDQEADSENTFRFSVNLSTCLAQAPEGAVDWDAGDTLFIDLQFRSSAGDNAAQKFCISRADVG